ncbi:hypothetical protein BDV93DRAFT_521400 [Ceratobasidium sp. AG-I]|nr:hypothetical protein BDV93DRAFT_521400 [Ceratobasidium sp. AG-I]
MKIILAGCSWRAFVWASLIFSFGVVAQQDVKVDGTGGYSLSNPNGIQFQGNWSSDSSDGAAQHYNGTYTLGQSVGDKLIFFFRGTGIAHYADKTTNGGVVSVSIDGSPYFNASGATSEITPQYQQSIWERKGLDLNDHQVIVRNMGGATSNSVIGLDFFQVTSGADGNILPIGFGPGTLNMPSDAVVVDDNADSISYSGSWQEARAREFYLGGTQRTSKIPGSTATFKFNGTAVWYFTDTYNINAMLNISLDGAPAEVVNGNSPKGNLRFQVLLWSKTGLTSGIHNLTITHVGATDTYACVDFFKYLPSITTTQQITPKPTFPTGAVVGGVVGGVVFLMIVLCLSIYFWKLRRSQTTSNTQHETYSGAIAYHAVDPFISSPSPPPYSLTTLAASGSTPRISRKRAAVNAQNSTPETSYNSASSSTNVLETPDTHSQRRQHHA